MNGKSIENNSFQSKSIVDFFELQGETVKALTYKEGETTEEYIPVSISITELESWLNREGYLQGEGEDCIGSNHSGDPVFRTSKWDFTIEEILNGTSDWNAEELLTDFINRQIK